MHRFINRYRGFFLIFVLAIGLVLRLIGIGIVPSGLTTDEAAITYDAWGLSLNGTDQWGHIFPLVFTSLGDGKLPLTHYLLALGFKLFGFHILGIRVVSALFGTALIGAMFLLVKALFPHRPSVAWIAATLTCISPWMIHFSRIGLEAGIAVTLSMYGLWFLITRRGYGIIFFILSLYAYHSSFIVVPILIIIGWKLSHQSWRWLFFYGCVVLLTTSPLVVGLFQSGWTRAGQTISLPQTPEAFGSRVLIHFSPGFWLWGEQDNYRQTIPGSFILLVPELLSFITGLAVLVATKSRQLWWVILWFVIALLPSFIGTPSPHTIRSFYLAPLIIMIASVGLYWWLHIRHSWVVWLVGWSLYWVSCAWNYTHAYRTLSATDFGYGYDQVMLELKKSSTIHSSFVISPFLGQPYLYTLLFWGIPPAEFRAGGLANVTYRPLHWPEPFGSILYAGSAAEIPSNDPRVLSVIMLPLTQKPLWVIAR